MVTKIVLKSLFLKNIILISYLLFTLLLINISAQAQTNSFADPAACTATKSIKITDIFVTTSFTPLIDGECSNDRKGGAQPLSLAVLPSILIRGYGLMASLIFYFFGINLLVGGLRWIYAGLTDDVQRQVAAAKSGIFRSVFALIVVVGAYVAIFTFLQVIGLDTIATTDIGSFFTL